MRILNFGLPKFQKLKYKPDVAEIAKSVSCSSGAESLASHFSFKIILYIVLPNFQTLLVSSTNNLNNHKNLSLLFEVQSILCGDVENKIWVNRRWRLERDNIPSEGSRAASTA